MCGRYTLKTTSIDLKKQLDLDDVEATDALKPRYNIAPMQAAPIIIDAAPKTLTLAQWGLLPHWAKDTRIASKLINARAETVLQKPAFRDLVKHHRCVVPCDGFFEWQRHGQQRTPFYIHPRRDEVMTMAGLWSHWQSPEGMQVVTFTIVTTEANELMKTLHTRMPVFLDRDARAKWLSHTEAEVQPLLVPWQGAPLEATQVEPHVNSVAIDDPSCIAPAKVVQLSLL